MKIQILIYDGFDDLDAIGPHEVFSKAQDLGEPFFSSLVVLSPPSDIFTSSGIDLKIKAALDLHACDLLVIPGGGWANRSEQGAWKEFQKGKIPEVIQQAHAAGIKIASVCTGALLVAKTGLLKNRPATTHQSAREDLEKLGALVKEQRVVDEGDILSSGGITSGIDLALWILEKFGSAELSQQVSEQLEYERSADIWQSKKG